MSQPTHKLLSEADVRALFIEVTTALCVAIILDGIDKSPEGYRIRSHDFYGSLPDIEIDSTHSMERVLDRISLSTARLGATVRFRHILATHVPDCQFMIPTLKCKATVVGLCTGGRTVRARGVNACQAYQKLNRKMPGLLFQTASRRFSGNQAQIPTLTCTQGFDIVPTPPFWKETSTC